MVQLHKGKVKQKGLSANIPEVINEIKVSYRPKKVKNWLSVIDSVSAAQILRKWFPENTICVQEQFVVLYLNRNNEVIGVYKLAIGSITGVVVDIRLILSVAVKCLAVSIIVAHNHPSGGISPSRADKELTKRLQKASELFEIQVLDHIIMVENSGYYSMADNGCL